MYTYWDILEYYLAVAMSDEGSTTMSTPGPNSGGPAEPHPNRVIPPATSQMPPLPVFRLLETKSPQASPCSQHQHPRSSLPAVPTGAPEHPSLPPLPVLRLVQVNKPPASPYSQHQHPKSPLPVVPTGCRSTRVARIRHRPHRRLSCVIPQRGVGGQ
jgi:hypothetical protein